MRHKDDIGDSTLGLIGKCIARSCQSCQKMVGSKNGDNAIGAALRTAIGVLLLLGLVGAWVRHRDAARTWWKSFVDGGKQSAMGQSGK